MATVANKARKDATAYREIAGEGLSEAVRRALTPRQSRLARHLLPLALSGSLTTIVGCSALPIAPLNDTPTAVVVPMVSTAPDQRAPEAIQPVATVAALAEQRPDIMASGSGPEQPQPPVETVHLPEAGLPPQYFDTDIESEVVGLRLAGSRSWQKLNVQDLDVVVRDPEVRYLPLLRILRILNIEHEYDDSSARFHLRGEPEIHIDLASQTGWIGDRKYDIELILGTSDITGRPEIYVAASNLQKLLPIYLAWDSINYEYKATTNHLFSVWERRNTERSLLFADANLVGMELPALLGTAQPGKSALSFLEMQWRSRFADGEAREQLSTFGVEPTAWGHLLGGRYKIGLANIEATSASASNNDVYGKSDSWVPNRAEWVYSLPRSEIVVGDSAFGLHDLMFPLTSYSGVRFNGLLGSDEKELDKDQSGRGLHRRFYRPFVFEGFAPVGSEVRLELNGATIATQRILEEADPITGQGVFRFEDIALPSTSLSNIRAVITNEDGVETEIERDMAAAPQLLPPGRIAYVGGFGTSRNSRVWETSGSLVTARALYGLNRHISVGTSIAFQNHFFDLTRNLDDDERNLPDQSKHVATEFIAMPLNNLTLSGDAAWSLGDDAVTNVDYDGKALRLRARYFPTDNIQIGSQWFSYSPGYFDGRNRKLENKAGYSVDAMWRVNSNWTFRAAAGALDDIEQPIRVVPTTGVFAQLGGVVLRDPIRTADYSQLQVSTGILPRTNLTLTLDRNNPSWEGPKTLTSVRSRTRFRNGVNLRMDASFGDNLTPETDQEYFQGLYLPGFRRFGEDNLFVTLDKKILPLHRVGIEYRGTDTVEKLMATHAFEGARLRLSTKFGWDYEHGDYAWEGWWDYPFNRGGRDRISVVTRFERTDWRADLSINFVSLFENDRRRVRRLPGDRFNPDRGGVKGRVFVDTNGNGILDQGERGLSDIEVAAQHNLTAHTDKNGRFYLPVSYGSREMQVALNLDSLPATYSVVHGRQHARIEPGGATEVNLAVAPLVSVSGAILLEVAEPDADAVAAYQRQLADEATALAQVELPEADVSAPGTMVLSTVVPVISDPNTGQAAPAAVAVTTEPALPVATAGATVEPVPAAVAPEFDYSLTGAPVAPVVGADALPAADTQTPRLVREVLPEGDGVIIRTETDPVVLPSVVSAAPAEYSVAREIDEAETRSWQTDVTTTTPEPDSSSVARVTSLPLPEPVLPAIGGADLSPTQASGALGTGGYTAAISAKAVPAVQRARYRAGEVLASPEATPVTGSASVEAIALARVIDARLLEPAPVDATPAAGGANAEAVTVARAAEPDSLLSVAIAGGAGTEAAAIARTAERLETARAGTRTAADSTSVEAAAVAGAVEKAAEAAAQTVPAAGSAGTTAVAMARTVDTERQESPAADPVAGSASTDAAVMARTVEEAPEPAAQTVPAAGSAGTTAVAMARAIDTERQESPVADPVAGSASTDAAVVARAVEETLDPAAQTVPAAGSAGTTAVAMARTIGTQTAPAVVAGLPSEKAAPARVEEDVLDRAVGHTSAEAVRLARSSGSEARLLRRATETDADIAPDQTAVLAAEPAVSPLGAASATPVILSRADAAPQVARTAPAQQVTPSDDTDSEDWILLTENGPVTTPADVAAPDDDPDWILITETGPQTDEGPASTTEAEPDAVSAGERVVRAMRLARDTLLRMSTTLTRDTAPEAEEDQRPTPPVQLAMTRRLEKVPSILAEPDVRLADTPEPEPTLKISRKIAARPETPPTPAPAPQERRPTRIDLAMARAIEQPPAPRTIVEVSPVETSVARSESERPSGMTMSRTLKPVQPTGRAVSGVRVVMRDANDKVVADSVTAKDGSFYLSNLKPGSYKLELDPRTIPEGFIVLEMSKTIEIREAEDFQEIELPPIYAIADLDNAALR